MGNKKRVNVPENILSALRVPAVEEHAEILFKRIVISKW